MTATALRTVLIEDERLARDELRRLLGQLPQIELVGEASSFESAAALLHDARPELAFMDVQLDGGSGLDLLATAPDGMHAIIVSAYEAYALRAFEVRAVDYLLKPVQPERLRAAVARALPAERAAVGAVMTQVQTGAIAPDSRDPRGGLAGPAPGPRPIGAAEAGPSLPPLDYGDHVFLALGETESLFLPVSSILAVVADGDYTRVQTGDGRTHVVPKPLKHWEARLPGQAFARIHRGAIVNLRSVRRVEGWFNRRFRVFVEGLPRPLMMSRRYAEALRSRLG